MLRERVRRWVLRLVVSRAACNARAAPDEVTVTDVSFATVVVPGTSAGSAVTLVAELYLPPSHMGAVPAVVILPTSAGIQPYREPYYARAFAGAGTAALVVNSFGARGI